MQCLAVLTLAQLLLPKSNEPPALDRRRRVALSKERLVLFHCRSRCPCLDSFLGARPGGRPAVCGRLEPTFGLSEKLCLAEMPSGGVRGIAPPSASDHCSPAVERWPRAERRRRGSARCWRRQAEWERYSLVARKKIRGNCPRQTFNDAPTFRPPPFVAEED